MRLFSWKKELVKECSKLLSSFVLQVDVEVVVRMKIWITRWSDVIFFFFCRIWCLVSNWLGFDTMTQGTLLDHIVHFCGLSGFLK